MKTQKISGEDIKQDNGSGRSLAQAFRGRRFHDKTIYEVSYNGVGLDNSTAASVKRSRNGYGN